MAIGVAMTSGFVVGLAVGGLAGIMWWDRRISGPGDSVRPRDLNRIRMFRNSGAKDDEDVVYFKKLSESLSDRMRST
jgi:hypothetical protein